MNGMITVVTSCSAAMWEQSGFRFVESFGRYWPKDAKLIVVTEDAEIVKECPCIEYLRWPDAQAFFKRHATSARAKGIERHASDRGWTPNKVARGYNFRYDAFRFAKKVFSIAMVADDIEERGRLFWLDFDVITFAPLGVDVLRRLLPEQYALSCLDRGTYHSECGFVGYNLDHPMGRAFVREFAALYASDHVFGLQEWHDSWVFDWLRRKTNVPTHSIPHQSRHHPFVNSELGRYADHCKGARKENGTQRRELVTNHDVPYWQARA